MAQWTMTDEAAGVPLYANNLLSVTGTSAAQYNVSVFGVSASEMLYANTADTEADAIAHAGWNLRKEGTGGRSGRVTYETLVAGGSMTGDGADDTQLPE